MENICFLCKGEMNKDFTTYFEDLGNCIVVIKNVPCLKCSQCGEVVFNGKTVKRIEEIVSSLKNILTEIAVVDYQEKTA